MAEALTALVCSAGRRVGLLRALQKAADELAIELRVVACDLEPDRSAACLSADLRFAAPPVSDPLYTDFVLELAIREGATLVVPTIDPELEPLASRRDDFRDAGIRLHVSPLDVVSVARNKRRTAEVLASAGVPVPKTWDERELRGGPGADAWPIVAKPIGGSSSRGLQFLDGPSSLPESFAEEMIFQTRLEGPEYTVNFFVDETGSLKSVVPHRRLRVRAGEVEKGVTERRPDLAQIALDLVAALPGYRGAGCFQLIDDRDIGPAVFEINARFGGGYPLADHAGATFAKWLLEQAADLESTANDEWIDGLHMVRFDDAIFYRGNGR